MPDVTPADRIEGAILTVRGQRVLLDAELAALYGVTTSRLNEQVKRNIGRFPADFMFKLSAEEADGLRSQFAISKRRGGRRHLPLAFTQEGVAMLSSVLHSQHAVAINIEIMRAFVRMRRMIAFEVEFRQRLDSIEVMSGEHAIHIAALYQAIQGLLAPPEPLDQPMGFRTEGAD